MLYGIIYSAKNTKNGKVYIGQTTLSLSKRIKKHYEKRDTYFHNALQKNEKDVFVWEVIDTAYSKEELDKKESDWIQFNNSTDREYGYNCTFGGYSGLPTVETRKKLSARQTGEKNHSWKGGKTQYFCCVCGNEIFDYRIRKYCSTECMRKGLSGSGNGFYGEKHTEKTKETISNKNKGKKRTPEQKEALAAYRAEHGHPRCGKLHTKETKEKLSVAAKKRYANKENHPMYGKKHTQAAIEKNRQSNIARNKLKGM